MTVSIYQDYVHNNGVLHRCLSGHFGPDAVRYCDAGDIADGCLSGAALFVMPGGADLYPCEKLNGPGNAAIRAFVERGGTYLGICAGAYYACAALEWAKNERSPICGPRELGFYKGTATGPVYAFMEDENFQKSWTNTVTMEDGPIAFPVRYGGGPVFTGDESAAILARYAQLPGKPAAIVECAIGKGRAVLCSPHIEYDATDALATLYRHENASFRHEKTAALRLKPGDPDRASWRRQFFERLVSPAERHRHAVAS